MKGKGLAITKLLVTNGAGVNKSHAMFGDEKDRKSPLDFAAGVPAIAEYLRSVGAQVGERDSWGKWIGVSYRRVSSVFRLRNTNAPRRDYSEL